MMVLAKENFFILDILVNQDVNIITSFFLWTEETATPLKPKIHDCKVARTLDGMLFGVKLVRPLPADRNRPDVLIKQVDYATWFMNHAVVRHFVFVNECGYNVWTARSHGRAR